jgi:hypothetical protein
MPTVFPPPPSGSGAYATPQIQKLLASDRADSDNFGLRVAVSADGNTAIIGANQEDTGANSNNGAAYVFIKSGSTWTEQQKLTASDAASDDSFGGSVSLSSDGNTAIISAASESTSPTSSNGAVYIFTRSGSTWTEQAKLLASDAASFVYFGASVSLSADGNTALVGAYNQSTSPNTQQGAAYVFTRSGSTWTQQAKLLASDRANYDSFGLSVDLSADGLTAVVGAYVEDTSPNTDQGAAYVFTRSGSTWTEEAKLLASDPTTTDYFGSSISISADGNTVIVGAYAESSFPTGANGAAYVFTRSAGVWSQQAKLLASDRATDDRFGLELAISADGNTALIGAFNESTSPTTNQGAAYIFTRSGSTWTEQAKLSASDAASTDYFGRTVNLSANGLTAIVGAVQEDTSPNTNQGAVYIYNFNSTETQYINSTGTKYTYNAAKNLWTLDNASPVKAPTTHVFTSSQTWAIPANAKMVHAWVIGAGGGGGSGAINSTVGGGSQGGAGGSGGALSRVTHNILAGYNDTTATITIGAGGTGGLGVNESSGGVGSTGTSGTASTINFTTSGSVGAITASGGAGGLGGLRSNAIAANTAQTLGMHYGSSGGGAAGGNSLTYQQNGLPSYGGAAGGGSGGGHPGSDTIDRVGGSGGSVVSFSVLGGYNYGTGTNKLGQSSSVYGPGSGGGGGYSYSAGVGGAGGLYGGGGGGGGSGRSGVSGAGGAGAQGVVVLMVWYG